MRIRLVLVSALVLAAGCGGGEQPLFAEGAPMAREDYRFQVMVILADSERSDPPPSTGNAQADLEAQYHRTLPAAMRAAYDRLRALRPPVAERDAHSALTRAFADAARELEQLDVDAGSDDWYEGAFAALRGIETATAELEARGYAVSNG